VSNITYMYCSGMSSTGPEIRAGIRMLLALVIASFDVLEPDRCTLSATPMADGYLTDMLC
jgi:hypothetical protein